MGMLLFSQMNHNYWFLKAKSLHSVRSSKGAVLGIWSSSQLLPCTGPAFPEQSPSWFIPYTKWIVAGTISTWTKHLARTLWIDICTSDFRHALLKAKGVSSAFESRMKWKNKIYMVLYPKFGRKIWGKQRFCVRLNLSLPLGVTIAYQDCFVVITNSPEDGTHT
jgi:hypothetical protein